jgi:hypothetical protein
MEKSECYFGDLRGPLRLFMRRSRSFDGSSSRFLHAFRSIFHTRVACQKYI